MFGRNVADSSLYSSCGQGSPVTELYQKTRSGNGHTGTRARAHTHTVRGEREIEIETNRQTHSVRVCASVLFSSIY